MNDIKNEGKSMNAMKERHMKFQDLLKKGFIFNSRRVKLTPQDIVAIERMINAPLPEQYRDYLLHVNGGGFERKGEEADDGYCVTILWPKENGIFSDEEPVSFGRFFAYDESLKQGDLAYTITLQYNFAFWQEYLPENTLPIAEDPGGGLFLIGIGKGNNGRITYWRRVFVNQLTQPGSEGVLSRAFEGYVADSFVEFVLLMNPLQ